MASRKFNKSIPYLLILPALAIIFPLLIYPVFYNVYLSFFSWKVLPPAFNFVKLQNYFDVFNNPVFWNSVKITLQFTGIVVGIQFVLGLGLAYLLNGQKFAKQTTRSIVLIPYISAPAIISLIWRLLWDPDLGQINQILRFFGIRGPGWIADPATSLFSVTVTEIWRGIPFVILVLLAGLQALPDEPYDAAKVDGASSVQIFFLITVPVNIKAKRNSFQERVKAKIEVAAKPGRLRGRVIRKKAVSREHPSITAASSSSLGMDRKKPRIIQITKGV
jgi:multiple sugar transport system permease protein